ncbi:hypothetical protein CPB84DRAFT_1678515, partial [Gymnopilus junonius]
DNPEDVLLITNIPPRREDVPPDSQGHSEWIVRASTKPKVINHPGFPQALRIINGPPAYEIKETPDTMVGGGVFATRDIKAGKLIFTERPLIVAPRYIDLPDPQSFQDLEPYTRERLLQLLMMRKFELLLKLAMDRMDEEDQNAFLALRNCHKEDGSGPLLGILRTNGFGINKLYDGEERTDRKLYTGVTKIGSRINHSCTPNVIYKFSLPSFSFQFCAITDIQAGEQLFFSFCVTDQSKAERHAELAAYGIICNCRVCEHATPETDKLRKEYQRRTRQYIAKVQQWTVMVIDDSPGSSRNVLNEERLEPILVLRDALREERLQYTDEYRAILWNVHLFYKKLGMGVKANAFLEEFSALNRGSSRQLASMYG